LLTISITNTKKNWVAAVTGNTKSCFKGVGKWGSGEVGKWGNGEMGEWGNGEMGKWGNGGMGNFN
jgi:hypothetical protein